MPCVTKCCCCWSLKYGNLVYGVISLASRICVLLAIYVWTSSATIEAIPHSEFNDGRILTLAVRSTTAGCMGWFICSSVALFIALKGIIQKRSILLYPYIVMLITETVFLVIISLIQTVIVTPWAILQLIITGSIDIYVLICLISLYQHMKQNEKDRSLTLQKNGNFRQMMTVA